MAKAQIIQARVLTDNASLGIKCGQIVEGPEKVINALSGAGAVDAHPEAVSYAATQGAEVVALENPDAAAALAAAVIESKESESTDTSSIVAN